MTTHDERATVAPTQTVDPEFSNARTERSRVWAGEFDRIRSPEERRGDERADAGRGAAAAGGGGAVDERESSPANAEQSQAGRCRRAPTSASADASSGDQLLFATDTSGLRSRWDDIQAAFVDDPQIAFTRPTRSSRKSSSSSRQVSPRRAHGSRRSGHEASTPPPRIFGWPCSVIESSSSDCSRSEDR